MNTAKKKEGNIIQSRQEIMSEFNTGSDIFIANK